ncbi:adenylyl-sulfate kinase [Plantactinospora sp. KLBMP9567]|uniref:adenylyl-sulfate kinase n=1 Tax=Plantactinospora sp. KLBMP9567 TaxID=3085900 RepID=UPI002980E8EA|nr:adenylyl-sulfate kinase [Plantactinospora sp. KLBMP9567]MDW5326757.1 adenylyl-sulfate kinase [Plantactinospora sp. KLBMP9567]
MSTVEQPDVRRARPGTVIWITGLSGAGKSSVARHVVEWLAAGGQRPILLDGDEVRAVLGVTSGFDRDSRRRLALTYARLCRLLSEQGHVVVCATISLFREVHEWNRAHLAGYFEVLLDVPAEELTRRNSKGLYGAGNAAREVAGMDLDVDIPVRPDLVLRNSGEITAQVAAQRILDLCAKRYAW